MTTNKNHPRAVASIALCCIALYLQGCASFESNIGKTVKATADTVEYARQGWTNYVWSQRALYPDPKDRQQLEYLVRDVGIAYDKYQRAMNALNIALTVYHNAPRDTRDKRPVETALSMLLASSTELISLIQSFYTSPTPVTR